MFRGIQSAMLYRYIYFLKNNSLHFVYISLLFVLEIFNCNTCISKTRQFKSDHGVYMNRNPWMPYLKRLTIAWFNESLAKTYITIMYFKKSIIFFCSFSLSHKIFDRSHFLALFPNKNAQNTFYLVCFMAVYHSY